MSNYKTTTVWKLLQYQNQTSLICSSNNKVDGSIWLNRLGSTGGWRLAVRTCQMQLLITRCLSARSRVHRINLPSAYIFQQTNNEIFRCLPPSWSLSLSGRSRWRWLALPANERIKMHNAFVLVCCIHNISSPSSFSFSLLFFLIVWITMCNQRAGKISFPNQHIYIYTCWVGLE